MTATFERTPQSDLAFAPAIPTKIRPASGRLLPASMIALGAVATLGWIGLLLWLILQMILTII
jgi:hypothetical protein